jgi:hypothetical protein
VDAENIRQESQHHLHEMQIMSNYLIDEKHADKLASYDWRGEREDEDSDSYTEHSKTVGKLAKHMKGVQNLGYEPVYDEMGQRKFNIDIRDIKVWSDISGGCLKQHWESTEDACRNKLNNFRNKRRYEAWLDDDEDDVEAD